MTLPQQVEEAGKRADEALAAAQGLPPEQESQSGKEPGADTVEGLQARITELEDDLKKSEHKYNVLQGKFKAEVEPIKEDVNLLKNLKGQVKKLTAQNEEFQRKVADLVTQNAQFVRQNKDLQSQLVSKNKETPVSGDEQDVSNLLSEEDRKILEDEGIEGPAIDVITKLIGSLARKNTPDSDSSTVSETGSQQPTDDEKKVAQDFWFGLDEAVEDWKTVNKTPAFLDWLSQLAPYHDNKTRYDILTEAQERWDLKTVVSIFNDFKATDSYTPEQVTPNTEQTPPNDNSQDLSSEHSLENQVEPNRGQDSDVIEIKPNVNAPGSPDKMLDPAYQFTKSEIKAFYKDATQSDGLYRTNRNLYDKIDQAIVKAGAEGRVVDG